MSELDAFGLAPASVEVAPTDSDMIDKLDAYGHLSWVVGFDGNDADEGDYDGDWLACFDCDVYEHPTRGVLVAYHVVVNSDSGGFIDTAETAVVEAANAPFDLPDYWLGIGMDAGAHTWTEKEIADATATNTNWNEMLRRELELAGLEVK